MRRKTLAKFWTFPLEGGRFDKEYKRQNNSRTVFGLGYIDIRTRGLTGILCEDNHGWRREELSCINIAPSILYMLCGAVSSVWHGYQNEHRSSCLTTPQAEVRKMKKKSNGSK